MRNTFSNQRYCSVNLNPYGTQLVEDDFRKFNTAPVNENEKIILSTGQQSIQLDKNNLDETVLMNILYCYNFLNTDDKDYVNSSDAELNIRKIKEENPQLFQLLYDVLQVVSDFDSNDNNIAKNLFISRLKNHLNNLKPDDTSSVYTLKTPTNVISEYFKNQQIIKPQEFGQETVLNRLNSNDFPTRYRHDSTESLFQFDQNDINNVDDKETVFNPNPLDNQVKQNINFDNIQNQQQEQKEFQHQQHMDYYDKINTFQNVKDFEHVLNTSSNVREYIVFNYNNEFDWEESLRELC